jgi:hypothetical protein
MKYNLPMGFKVRSLYFIPKLLLVVLGEINMKHNFTSGQCLLCESNLFVLMTHAEKVKSVLVELLGEQVYHTNYRVGFLQ